LGGTYENLGQRKEAIISYKEAIRINPHLSLAFSNLGILYGRMGQYQESSTYLKKSIRTGMTGGAVNAGVHNGLGAAYQALGRNDEAIEEYKEALRLDPTLTLARDNLNNLLQKEVPDQDFQTRQHLSFPVIGSFDKINDVFKGTLNIVARGTAKIKIQGIYSKMKCEGDSYITLSTNNPSCQDERGEAKLKCDDGRIVNSDFRMQTCTSGAGEGEDQFGDMFTFAFGMSEEDAQAYLNKEIDLVAKRQKLIKKRQRQQQAQAEKEPRSF
jgi:tetratricopeptide (TPR) repeat protein